MGRLLEDRPLLGQAQPRRAPDEAGAAQVQAWLARPLDAEAAVRIALAQAPRMQAAFAALQLSDAERVQAATLPNPVLSFARLREGQQLELDRALAFNVLGLLTLPWQARWAGQQHEVARLQAAQQVLQLAADTRRAWVRAVAAEQSAIYLRDAAAATEAGAELAERMARAGNWSALQRTRQQLVRADAVAELARAEQAAVAEREQLARLLGLDTAQAAALRLPPQLPVLPEQLPDATDAQARALRDRLDLRAARAQAAATADALGLTHATAVVDALALGPQRKTTFANDGSGQRSTQRGWGLAVPLPLFDWGQARNARAQALYLQAAAQVRGTAVAAASEARQAEQGRRSAWQVAQRYQREVLPLRRQVNDEMVLRYNAMLSSVWELLAETRASMLAVNAAMQAQRDFWLADTELQLALTGSSPAGLAALQATAGASPAVAGGVH